MGIEIGNSLVHWNYFLALEKDLENLARYVEFCKPNFACYSLEMARILFAAASEVDVIAKQLCKKINNNSVANNINQYRDEIKAVYTKLPNFKVTFPKFGLDLIPWLNWNEDDGIPFWWTAYNKVKHQRDTDFEKANLQNSLNSVAGLFIITLYLYKEKAENAEIFPMPSLLRAGDEYFSGTSHNGVEFGINYNL